MQGTNTQGQVGHRDVGAIRVLVISETPGPIVTSLSRELNEDRYFIRGIRPNQLDFSGSRLTSAILVFDIELESAKVYLKNLKDRLAHKSLYNYYSTILISTKKNKEVQKQFYKLNIDHVVLKKNVSDILPLIVERMSGEVEHNQHLVNHTIELHSRLLSKERESGIDELTGLQNMRDFRRRLQHEVQKRFRSGGEFALIMFDIDNFKGVNDTTDHVFGSYVLKKIGKIIRGQIRETDTAGRFGGDEFVVLLHGTGARGARRVAEKIRKAIEDADFSNELFSVRVGASFGSVSFSADSQIKSRVDDTHLDRCLRLVDGQLYLSKEAGKNTVSAIMTPVPLTA